MKAKQRKRPVTPMDVERIGNAESYLQAARALLRKAGAGNAANYAARALKSAQGALRHAEGRLARQTRETTK